MLDKFTSREKMLIGFLGALIVLGGLGMGLKKFLKSGGEGGSRLSEMRRSLYKIARIRDRINSLPPASSLPDATRLLSDTTRIANKHGLDITGIKSRRGGRNKRFERIFVDVSFRKIQLNQVLKMLHDIEIGGRVQARVAKLSISRLGQSREETAYNVSFSLLVERPREKRARGGRRK